MNYFVILLLAVVQGAAELLPVSSSAHVIFVARLLKIDPSSPDFIFLLVMLHTGTMFAVIAYFWKQWKKSYFATADAFKRVLVRIVWATVLTGVIGEVLIKIIERTAFKGAPKAEIELLFGRLELVAPALAVAGIVILIAGLLEKRRMAAFVDHSSDFRTGATVTMRQAGWIGAVQGLCLPFRGFSRSGATISTGMLAGATKERAERFSFALAVVLTPPVVVREGLRLLKATHAAAANGTPIDLHGTLVSALLGAVFSFIAGLVALKWLSSWLESGRWYLFGIYCLVASCVVFYLHTRGY